MAWVADTGEAEATGKSNPAAARLLDSMLVWSGSRPVRRVIPGGRARWGPRLAGGLHETQWGPIFRCRNSPTGRLAEQQSAGLAGAGAGAAPAETQPWWTRFNDPALTGLVDEAMRQNVSVRIAGLRILESEAQLGIPAACSTRNSNDYPAVRLRCAASTRSWARPVRSRPASSLPDSAWAGNWISGASSGAPSKPPTQAISPPSSIRRYPGADGGAGSRTLCQRARTGSPPSNRPRKCGYPDAVTNHQASVQERQRIRTRCTAGQNPVPEHTGQHSGAGEQPASSAERAGRAARPTAGAIARDGDAHREIPAIGSSFPAAVPAEVLRRRPDVRVAEMQLAAQSALIGVAEADKYPSLSLLGAFNLSVLSVSGSPTTSSLAPGAGSDMECF